MNLFENLKVQIWKKSLNISENNFYKQILDFHSPSKILSQTSKL